MGIIIGDTIIPIKIVSVRGNIPSLGRFTVGLWCEGGERLPDGSDSPLARFKVQGLAGFSQGVVGCTLVSGLVESRASLLSGFSVELFVRIELGGFPTWRYPVRGFRCKGCWGIFGERLLCLKMPLPDLKP